MLKRLKIDWGKGKNRTLQEFNFVVLHHTAWPAHADHFDLLLQTAGGPPDFHGLAAFATLADVFPAGNPPALLRRSPDHRLAYLRLEGAVSGGRGKIERVEGGELSLPARVDWGQAVSFRLKSTRLDGQFWLRPLGRGLHRFELQLR